MDARARARFVRNAREAAARLQAEEQAEPRREEEEEKSAVNVGAADAVLENNAHGAVFSSWGSEVTAPSSS